MDREGPGPRGSPCRRRPRPPAGDETLPLSSPLPDPNGGVTGRRGPGASGCATSRGMPERRRAPTTGTATGTSTCRGPPPPFHDPLTGEWEGSFGSGVCPGGGTCSGARAGPSPGPSTVRRDPGRRGRHGCCPGGPSEPARTGGPRRLSSTTGSGTGTGRAGHPSGVPVPTPLGLTLAVGVGRNLPVGRPAPTPTLPGQAR